MSCFTSLGKNLLGLESVHMVQNSRNDKHHQFYIEQQCTDVTHQTAGPWTEDSDECLGSSPSSVGTLCRTRASTSIPSAGIDQGHN